MPRYRLASGYELSYEVFDFSDPWSSFETVLLHHGLGKSGVYWRPWVRELVSQFRVVTVDSLGNGASSQPTDYGWSIEGYADDVVELTRHLTIEKIHFVGEGLGGCVGIHLAATKPNLVRTLTMASTPYRPSDGSGDLRAASELIDREGLEVWTDNSIQDRMAWDELPQEMFDWYRQQRLQTSARIMAEQMRAQAGVDLEWALPEIVAPTLLLVPGRSHVAANQQMLRMGQTIRDATVVRFPDEGQWITFERPGDCVSAFRDFVGAVRE